ncbi:E3 ubiquitin-protein ligase RGLG4-like [Homalodisca vitripennis]|uniref:E3 ubiquitin-protein ligase RGLG4-like n=1 Tax=Homalodisca vitripennis TaxID=197043 RepID=UPI001EEC9D8A|nr:E3 ubiquitin-protein ligase RGLG4-like [Homalodisca vitripennis]
MRELQWTASRIFLDTDHRRQIRLAPETWRELREDLENFLRSVGERMEDARRNNTTPPPPDAEETPLSQPRKVECPVCMVNLPTVALRLCGHTLCRTCADRVHTCPTCRALIVGRFNIYLPR